MAWNTQRNQIYHERCKNVAVAMKNMAEEAQRLRDIFVQQLQSEPEEFADTDIATKTEITTFQSYLTQFLEFYNGSGSVQSPLDATVNRGLSWTLPLIDSTAS